MSKWFLFNNLTVFFLNNLTVDRFCIDRLQDPIWSQNLYCKQTIFGTTFFIIILEMTIKNP